jgi:hypothetical protein
MVSTRITPNEYTSDLVDAMQFLFPPSSFGSTYFLRNLRVQWEKEKKER